MSTVSSPQTLSPPQGIDGVGDSPKAISPTAAGNPNVRVIDLHDDVIPPTHSYRTLILCFDGTGDQFDADVSIHLILYLSLGLMALPELQYYPILLHAEEG